MLDQSLNEICLTVTMLNQAVVLHVLNNFALISCADFSCHSIRNLYRKLLVFLNLTHLHVFTYVLIPSLW